MGGKAKKSKGRKGRKSEKRKGGTTGERKGGGALIYISSYATVYC